MKKKGQGMPLNVVIIAVIVLVVLIVLWVIFTGRASKFSESLTKQDAELDQDKLANQLSVCSAITSQTACGTASNCEFKGGKCVVKGTP